ncbi:glycine zipper 2TM domain-containing protein [Verticiella sediminum]|uniref:Glycine zipper 2TM domain-containing protein n=1 Tax=Verticiella sediminum TaxID=1247510 RepID=A0A556AVD8_9BURK|nr:glycine zipper 2TM domain-containing protein [Verticiella sediminum]
MAAQSVSPKTSRIGGRAMVAAVVLGAVTLAGCANQSASGNVYSFGQAQREQVSRAGTVLNVRNITIQPEQSTGAGTVAGAALGGLAGNQIGGGSGRTIATVVGGLAGALAGTQAERGLEKRAGYEITVRLDNGEVRVVAQEADVQLYAGQRVQVISGSGTTRVIPAS